MLKALTTKELHIVATAVQVAMGKGITTTAELDAVTRKALQAKGAPQASRVSGKEIPRRECTSCDSTRPMAVAYIEDGSTYYVCKACRYSEVVHV